MIVKCTYETNSDIGLFESYAKLNTQTGEVFDIEESKGDDQENIDEIYSKTITFNFEGIEYTAHTEENDDGYTIENTPEFKTILAIQRNQKIDDLLEEKVEKKSKKKI